MDDSLYTGANSGSYNDGTQRTLQEKQNEKQQAKAKLLPAYEYVKEAIDQEIAATKDLDTFYADSVVTPDVLHRELVARKAYLNFLRDLDARMSNVVRKHERRNK